MSDIERAFHESWLGMVQPIEGLVVSIPVLVAKECFERQAPALQYQFKALCEAPAERNRKTGSKESEPAIQDLPRLFEELLGLTPDLWDAAAGYASKTQWAGTIPEAVSYASEGSQLIRPTLALRKQGEPGARTERDGETAQAAAGYEMLVWELPAGLSMDKPETATGPWDYPASAKFERLLRAARVPIGLLSNGQVLRLLYAPHGEATGHVDFRVADMAQVGGRPILDAFVMLLHARRFFSVAEDRALPAILAESRKYQGTVTNELGEQVFEALTILLRGFEAASERDPRKLLDEALARENDHLTQGLLTVLLRIVFVLFAEDRGLLPVENPLYRDHYSVFALYERLLADHGAFPDSMSRRYGAWGQLIALFRALHQGVSHEGLKMPARRGTLFSPHRFAFLEGWEPDGTSPLLSPKAQAEVKLPTLDDETVFLVLSKLIMLDGQRLSYRTLDVEQIGSVYEGLMGYHVARMRGAAVRMKPDGVWLSAEEVLEVAAGRREAFLAEHVNLPKAQAKKLAAALHGTKKVETAFEALLEYAHGRTKDARAGSSVRAGQLVLQPGPERRRTSSHYTPRSLSSKVVERTLEPLLRCTTEEGAAGPSSERILQLRVCDPAMGSGAFLVEACRYLGDALVAAWTRENKLGHHADPVLAARRRIAQCCLYGVDKNAAAVELAKLSMWLVTLAKQRPFTFLDGNLRHGDSLVGLNMEQLRAFHWKPSGQRGFAELRIEEALQEAIGCREKLRELAQKENGVNPDPGEKMILLRDAEDALSRLRLISDVCVGAFFACDSDRAREHERLRRRDLVEKWLASDGSKAEKIQDELRELQTELWKMQTPFHWMLEFTDVFWDRRADPLEPHALKASAQMDAFVGNPPFMGGTLISVRCGESYRDWLSSRYGASSLTDLSAFFFRRTDELLGPYGTAGLIATNSISQGDTRETGLSWICRNGGVIYCADRNLDWPGEAGVSVSIVHFARGIATPTATLDGSEVPRITSYLSPLGSENPPAMLAANRDVSVIGSFVLGIGFVFEEDRPGATSLSVMRDVMRRAARNREVVRTYLGGEDINTNPTQSSSRYIIDFEERTENEARSWPDLFAIVEEKVKPARASVKQRDRREKWWLHATRSPLLRAYVAEHHRALALSQVSSHLALTFVGPGIVLSHTCVIILAHAYAAFGLLQSRLHESWARFLASSLESRLRYTPTDCFETFPFPQPNTHAALPKLESLGEDLYSSRAKYMLDTQQGLTKTYNALKDPSCTDRRILALREQHEAMDAAVLAEYSWDHVKVAPFCAKTAADTADQETFKSKVIDLLYELNAQRAKEEQGSAPAARPKKSKAENDNGDTRTKKTATASSARPGPVSTRPTGKRGKKASGGAK